MHHDREWIPARREQRGSDIAKQPNVFPAEIESAPRTGVTSSGPRRDRPSRFDQPLSSPAPPVPAIVPGLPSTTERPLLNHRERDAHHSDANAHARQAERRAERDVLTPSLQVLIDKIGRAHV